VQPSVQRSAAQPQPEQIPASMLAATDAGEALIDAVPVDAISAAPLAKWFVRPPSGGQFGPAPGKVLREWIAAGRVTPESYVWREGWPEWQRAWAVFGDLASAAPVATISTPAIVTQATRPGTNELYRRRKSNRATVITVGLLGFACVVLFAALVYVVRFMQ
jgi:hypothetical protein